jgi:hypothetical protein
MEIKIKLQVRSLLVQNYGYILTCSACEVTTSLDNNADYDSGDAKAIGCDEDHKHWVRIHLLLNISPSNI